MDKFQHDDKCRWWDDEEFCTCGAIEIDRLERELTAAKEEIERLATRNRYLEDASDAIGILFRGRRGLEDIIKLRKRAEAAEFLLTSERKETERLREDVKRIAVEFFYYWHNAPGTNTEQGFDEWYKTKAAIQERQGEE